MVIVRRIPKERVLYAKLVFNLGLSRGEAVNVVAFLMWLQTVIMTDVIDFLIGEMIKMQIRLCEAITDEIIQCLKCVRSEIRPFTEDVYELQFLRTFVIKSTGFDLNLDHLHRNRHLVLTQVRRMVNKFNGIDDKDAGSTTASPRQAPITTSRFFRDIGDGGTAMNDFAVRGSQITPISGARWGGKGTSNGEEVGESSIIPATPPKSETRRYVPLSLRREEEDGRTVFLTFSNGYPIPAHDVAAFFNRKFGRPVVEKIYMQNVEEQKKVLYARMVCVDPAAMEAIIYYQGDVIAKYVIGRRHVWARKYEKRYQPNRAN